MKVLFLNDGNGFEGADPRADLVEILDHTSIKFMQILERRQIGAYRTGGSWQKIMSDGNIPYVVLSHGRKSDYSREDCDKIYRLISGNY